MKNKESHTFFGAAIAINLTRVLSYGSYLA